MKQRKRIKREKDERINRAWEYYESRAVGHSYEFFIEAIKKFEPKNSSRKYDDLCK